MKNENKGYIHDKTLE